MAEIAGLIPGGHGKGGTGRRREQAQHECTVSVPPDRDAEITVQVGYHDGSDWPDNFTREEWVAFSDRVVALLDAGERQRELGA